MELFTYTEAANFCYMIVWCSSFDDIPFDVMGDALSFEILLILRIYVTVVLSNPGLQRVVGGTSVGFPMVGVSQEHSSSF